MPTVPAPQRPLDLDPARASREARAPYGIVDIGSNSVRLVVYDQLGRAPLPRFNEKSLCRLGEGLAETGAIRPDEFPPHRRGDAALRAPSPRRCVSRELDVTATEAIRRAAQRAGAGRGDRARIRARRCAMLSGADEARYCDARRRSPASSGRSALVGDMGGGRLEVAQALDDHVGERSVSLPLGALPVEALLAGGPRRGASARSTRCCARACRWRWRSRRSTPSAAAGARSPRRRWRRPRRPCGCRMAMR